MIGQVSDKNNRVIHIHTINTTNPPPTHRQLPPPLLLLLHHVTNPNVCEDYPKVHFHAPSHQFDILLRLNPSLDRSSETTTLDE